MNQDYGSVRRLVPFLSLIVLYGMVIALVLILSQQILSDISQGMNLTETLVLPLTLILPLALLGAIVYQILALLRDRRKGKPGTSLKIRLTLFFSFTALLSSVPQAILSVNFVDTTMNSWFGANLGEALDGGVKTSLAYYHDKAQTLKNFAESRSLPTLLSSSLGGTSDHFWDRLSEAAPAIGTAQLFDKNARLILNGGDPRGFIKNPLILQRMDGALPKENIQDVSILRTLKHFSFDSQPYTLVMAIILPDGFDEVSNKLTRARETYRQLQKFNDTFRSVVVLFYIIFAFPIFLISLLIAFSLADDIIRPVVNLEEATKRVAEGDFSIRILTQNRDELSTLVGSFNAMVSELELSRTKIQQTEKITAWQEIAQQLAHELRNPLTPIKLSAERIIRKYRTDPVALEKIIEPAVHAIVHEVDRLDTLLKEFSDFARLPTPVKELADLAELVEEACQPWEVSEPGVTFRREGLQTGITALVDRKQMLQVFTNLIKNAVEAMNGLGTIFVRSSLVKKGYTNYCRIQVQDTGPGIGSENRDRVFNPYFTTKKAGTGLGLSIVERIIFDHGGSIWFESQPGFGTTFFIDLNLEKA